MKTVAADIRFCDRLLALVAGKASKTRLENLSREFLSLPYIERPLGEGEFAEFDQGPAFRFDGFDCVTYVNTVLALYFATSWYGFLHHLKRLNYYSGNSRYENRYHFISADWNPQNAAQGYVAEATPRASCHYAVATINKSAWLRQHEISWLRYHEDLSQTEQEARLQKLHAIAGRPEMQPRKIGLPYLSLQDLFNNEVIWSELPAGVVLEMVRPNWNLVEVIGTHLNVSHVGFLLDLDGKLVFRHASQALRQVVDQPLKEYLASFLNHPTVKGINLQAIKQF